MISHKGFTLIEVLVALIIGVLIIGSIMALNSVSLRNQRKLERLDETLPVLDAAAQKVFENPKLVLQGEFIIEEFENKPVVKIEILNPEETQQYTLPYGRLYRVRLTYEGDSIEFSVIVPEV